MSSITWIIANSTQSAPMIPMSAHEKMLHSVSPSLLVAEMVLAKKSLMHLDLAWLCRVIEMMSQAAATPKAATVSRLCRVT